MLDRFERGAVNLGNTPEGVDVLHPIRVLATTSAGQEISHPCRDQRLTEVRAGVVDERIERLLLAPKCGFLTAGMMQGGVVSSRMSGTPQGSPLSPLLSNVLLDDLDRELERRGHRFVRYADDVNVYVRSRRAGERVMASLTQFLERKLKLRVNRVKSAVDRPWKRKFLGYSVTVHKKPRLVE